MPATPERSARRSTSPRRRLLGALVLFALVVPACGSSQNTQVVTDPRVDLTSASGSVGGVTVREAYIPAPTGPVYQPGAGLVVKLRMDNDGPTWDSIVRAGSPDASAVTLSQLDIPQDFLSIPNDSQEIEGTVQLHDITRPLAPGQDVRVTVQVQPAGSLTLQVPIRRAPGPPAS